MYFIIAPFIAIGLITKLINNKINMRKHNNDSLVDSALTTTTLGVNSLSDMISNYKKQIIKKADQHDTQKYNVFQIKKKEAGN